MNYCNLCTQGPKLLRSSPLAKLPYLSISSQVHQLGDRDRGVKTYRTLEGGGDSPRKLSWENAWTSGPKLRIFYRISVERAQIQGPPKIETFHPPL